ncbi:4Fe-4S dicluster domain-containing protein [Parasporobacterium paucivorans]|uniref:4Fe-4S dicluster domain-containing protein n=1 Tax=Parasporobacterium paucivorans DSM 15970 TaxID=1122934 RepID=A0A1M6DH91_9FIRM|nr:4Fe-4S dicluster domain-containing protein [Parasporobacterium paucivorans]SHI72714.1 4Fe-4S dicluster domain-containing protein [Parasporobacterium paucivorans DSM 15970]
MQLDKSDLQEALRILSAEAGVFVPSVVEGVSRFALWDGESSIDLSRVNTELPPKDILFPQTEKMYSYKMGKNIEIKEIIDNPKQVVFGIRPCDVKSIGCMDKVFLEKTYVDSFYAGKRENLTVISVGCTQTDRTCFCDSMGLSPSDAPGADVMMNDTGDTFVVEAYTDKGKQVMEAWKPLLKKGGKKPAAPECTLKVKMSPEISVKLSKMFEHPIWEEVSRPCIGCATCTYVCPTCYCFDMNSDNHSSEGTKFRCWDSCMFSDYSRMAGGHNPRPGKKERVRNRYMHKLSYFNERYETSLCAGCGRCADKCPAHMDITAFIDRVAEEEMENA